MSAPVGRAVELFAGVGGFRHGLEGSGWEVIWANQWEPSTKTQHAFDCYVSHFKSGVHVNEDIDAVLREIAEGKREPIPDHDLLVGGFPCQDYSVAKALGSARGINGDKGALWWSIHRILDAKSPRFVLLENVDRLLKSPSDARGRDFAIILLSLSDLGYDVEWRVVNAADYGFPQRRRRVFILAHREGTLDGAESLAPYDWLLRASPLAKALPVARHQYRIPGWSEPDVRLETSVRRLQHGFQSNGLSPFRSAGFMSGRNVWTMDVTPVYRGRRKVLADVIEPEGVVPARFFIPRQELPHWKYLKGKKSEERISRDGHRYVYAEGGIPFPDPLDQPSRTILTSEGGSSPSRFRHVVRTESGGHRKLMPVELERLNGFPDGWTAGMSDGRRAYMMGNALVVGLVTRVTRALAAVYAVESGPLTGAA